MGKSTISTGPFFNSKLLVYQRVKGLVFTSLFSPSKKHDSPRSLALGALASGMASRTQRRAPPWCLMATGKNGENNGDLTINKWDLGPIKIIR